MRRIEWLRTHPWIGTAFLSGVLLGMLACLPLVPYELPESTATLGFFALNYGNARQSMKALDDLARSLR